LTEANPIPTRPLYAKLPGGRRGADGLSKDEVAADQRRRLHGAMVEAVDRRGYQQTTAREVCRLAGVSERAFYELFDNKHGCFLASYDTIVLCGVERIGAAYRSPGAWQAKLRAAFDAYATVVVSDPKAARLVLVEAFGAGPAALARMRDTRLIFERILSASFSEAPDGVMLPALIAKAIVCGVERITRQRLLAGGVQELPALAEELLAWALSYRSTAAAGLAASSAAHYERCGCDRSAVRVKNDRARILRCAASLAAANGYAGLTPAQIVCAAEVSEARFDELFQSTEQCFLDALDRLGLEALVCAAQASRGSDDPLAGVHRGIVALLRHVAGDPVLLRVAFVEIFALGPAGIERRERLLGQFTDLLASSLPHAQRPSDLVAEASAGAIWGLLHHYVTHGDTHQLPGLTDYATYIALAPVLGGEEAIKAIRDDQQGPPTRRVARQRLVGSSTCR
jgi:AcrR family transcriptional regulator